MNASPVNHEHSLTMALIGGAGFIGAVLARQLRDKGHQIRILDVVPSGAFPDHSRIVDVRDEKALVEALAGVDVIYNLAAEHRDDVRPISKYYDVNVDGAENIAAAADHHGIKTIIFTSTVAVYGLNADPDKGATEDTAPAPFNDYGQSKLQAEGVLEAWRNSSSDKSLTIIRLVATFGPGNRGNIYTLMNQISRNRFIMIGAGQNRKSMAYVENVAGFLVHALSFGRGTHVYNYADKPDLDTMSLVKTLRRAFGKQGLGLRMPYVVGLFGGVCFDFLAFITRRKFPISRIRVEKFCANTVVNADKVKATGFVPGYTLDEGLRTMIEKDFDVSTK